jgi:hypothetical protein
MILLGVYPGVVELDHMVVQIRFFFYYLTKVVVCKTPSVESRTRRAGVIQGLAEETFMGA